MPTRILECAAPSAGSLGIQIVPRVLNEQAAFTASATPTSSTAVVSALTRILCVQSDEQVYVTIGKNPAVTTNSYRIAAGGEQFFECGVGDIASVRT